jgi:hypothetical protein
MLFSRKCYKKSCKRKVGMTEVALSNWYCIWLDGWRKRNENIGMDFDIH